MNRCRPREYCLTDAAGVRWRFVFCGPWITAKSDEPVSDDHTREVVARVAEAIRQAGGKVTNVRMR